MPLEWILMWVKVGQNLRLEKEEFLIPGASFTYFRVQHPAKSSKEIPSMLLRGSGSWENKWPILSEVEMPQLGTKTSKEHSIYCRDKKVLVRRGQHP